MKADTDLPPRGRTVSISLCPVKDILSIKMRSSSLLNQEAVSAHRLLTAALPGEPGSDKRLHHFGAAREHLDSSCLSGNAWMGNELSPSTLPGELPAGNWSGIFPGGILFSDCFSSQLTYLGI